MRTGGAILRLSTKRLLAINRKGEKAKMTKVPTTAEIEAVAVVIKSIGFNNLAEEFVSRPDDREKIVKMATNIMRRDGNVEQARKFYQLATWTLKGLWVSA
jgi:hypothetical protein